MSNDDPGLEGEGLCSSLRSWLSNDEGGEIEKERLQGMPGSGVEDARDRDRVAVEHGDADAADDASPLCNALCISASR